MSNPASVNKLKVVDDTQCQLNIYTYLNTQVPILKRTYICTSCTCTCQYILSKLYILKTIRIPPGITGSLRREWCCRHGLDIEVSSKGSDVDISVPSTALRDGALGKQLDHEGSDPISRVICWWTDCWTVVDTDQLKEAGHWGSCGWKGHGACHPECFLAAMRWTALSTTSDP